MSEEVIRVVRCTFRVPGQHDVVLRNRKISLLEKRTTRIHPAIDFVDGKAYVGIYLPVQIVTQRKKRGGEDSEPEIREEDHLWLVTSDRRIFYAGDYQYLRGMHGYVLTHRPLATDVAPRWNLDDLAAWLTPPEGDLPKQYTFLEPDSVYTAVRDAIAYYIEFPDPRDLDFWTLMTIGTYFVRLFDAYPIGYVGGIKRVGKTKLLLTVSLMGFNSVMSASLTAPYLFRIIQDARATLFVDETETLFDAERNQALRAIILAAYKKGQAAHRVGGADGEVKRPMPFEIFASLFFANIQGLEDVLEDRAIPRILLRASDPEIMRREPSITDPRWGKIRSGLYRLYLERAAEVAELAKGTTVSDACDRYGVKVEGEDVKLEGRELELWRPIVTLALFFEKHGVQGLTEKIVTLAKEIGLYKAEESLTESADMILIQVLREMVTKDSYYPVSEIKTRLITFIADNPDQPPKWLNSAWVGRALKRLRITERRRLGTHREYRITPKQVANLMTRVHMTGKTISGDSEKPPHPAEPSLPSPPPPLYPDLSGTAKITLRKDKEEKNPEGPRG